MISCRSQGGRAPSHISHDLSSMRFALLMLLLAVPLPSPAFRPGPGSIESPEDESRRAGFSSLTLAPSSRHSLMLLACRPADLIPPARLLETGSWYLCVV